MNLIKNLYQKKKNKWYLYIGLQPCISNISYIKYYKNIAIIVFVYSARQKLKSVEANIMVLLDLLLFE